ncbi:MAG TPA: aminotransferase class I/II-fold pyridoxal phosphate-dependent enzyme, partial [Aestuariivirga sp.]|nr:aminotransferase class I/II-fold pyridoxal phosphate-dependent enzyme [Aestuariivirga sp.]
MRMARIADRLANLGAEKWQVHFEGRRRAAAGEKVIFLSIGEPDAPPPAAVLDVAEKAMRAGRYRYAPGQGEANVLAALARTYSRSTGRTLSPEQFLYLPGTQTALYVAAMTVLDEGDEILLPDPYYATYEGVVAAPGAVAVPVRLDPDRGFHPHVADFERAITPKTRALLINSPGNPTGAVYSADEMAAIGAMARKHDLWIISDEVYATLTHGNRKFVSPFHDAALEERTVVVSSLSKSHNMPGFRCGWIAASADFVKRAVAITETMLFG